MKEAEAAGKYYLGITPSTATDRNAARYGFATMLLAGGGKLQFALHDDYTNERWFEEFDYTIGTPAATEIKDAAASTSAPSPTASSTSTRRRARSASTSAAPTPAPGLQDATPRHCCHHEAAWCSPRQVMARPFRSPRRARTARRKAVAVTARKKARRHRAATPTTSARDTGRNAHTDRTARRNAHADRDTGRDAHADRAAGCGPHTDRAAVVTPTPTAIPVVSPRRLLRRPRRPRCRSWPPRRPRRRSWRPHRPPPPLRPRRRGRRLKSCASSAGIPRLPRHGAAAQRDQGARQSGRDRAGAADRNVRMKTAALAATSRHSTPPARVRVRATGGLSATLVDSSAPV